MLSSLEQLWGGLNPATFDGKETTDEVCEVLSSRTFCPTPVVPVKVLPPYQGPLAELENTLVTTFRLQEIQARSLLFEAFGAGRSQFQLGRHIDCKVIPVPKARMVRAGYSGVGYMFHGVPAHLVWFMLLHSVGPGAFYLQASSTRTLVCFKDTATYTLSSRLANAALRNDVVFWINQLIEGTKDVFDRMLSLYSDPPPLWNACPAYYRNFICLVDALDYQSGGVILGALCPQIPRAGRPEGEPRSVVQWYLDAGDPSRPLEWRRKVVEALALPGLARFPVKAPKISARVVRDAFPDFPLVLPAGRLVKNFCLAQVDNFPVLVPDSHRLTGDTRTLDRAVCVGDNAPPRRRLPSAHLSDRVMALVRAIS